MTKSPNKTCTRRVLSFVSDLSEEFLAFSAFREESCVQYSSGTDAFMEEMFQSLLPILQ